MRADDTPARPRCRTRRWAEPLEAADAWNVACLTGNNKESCPNIDSPDYDFAQAPMLVNACKSGSCKQLVVAGQKSGWLWALQPDIGRVEWGLPVGPGERVTAVAAVSGTLCVQEQPALPSSLSQ